MRDSSKKHIVFLRRCPSSLSWGGLEKLTLEWFQRIDYSKCRVTLAVTPGGKELSSKQLLAKGVNIGIIEFPFDFRAGAWKSFGEMFHFIRALKPSTIVFIQGAFTDFRLATVFAGFLLSGGNVFMHENLGAPVPPGEKRKNYFGFIPGLSFWWFRHRLWNNLRAILSRKILVVSQGLKDRLVDLWAYAPSRVKVAYHGVDIQRFSPGAKNEKLKRELGMSPSDTVIVATARFAKEKCLDRLINAFDIIADKFPSTHLLLIGAGPLEKELKALAGKKKFRGRIHFLGHRQNVVDCLRTSDIYVLSSDNEGLSLALMEAMATGLICISTNCPGSDEVIQSGVNGYIVEKSMQGILAGLTTVLKLNAEERQHILNNGVAFVRKNFNINERLQDTFQIMDLPYKDVYGGNGEASVRAKVSVSVIIPTYNYARFLPRAIESVLNQTCQDFEIIVVDDGSTDNTKEVLMPFMGRIRYIYEDNRGISGARNRGIRESKGTYIAFLDSDDTWASEKLAVQLNIFKNNNHIGLIYSKTSLFNESGKMVDLCPTREPGKNSQELAERLGYLPTSTIMTKREYFDKVGLFDETLTTSEDLDMWTRIGRVAQIYEVKDKFLARHYNHGENISANELKMYEGWVRFHYKVLKEYSDIASQAIANKLSQNEYALSRIYYRQKKFFDCLYHLKKAIGRNPNVGLFFYTPQDSFWAKIKKIINPYFLLMACSFKALLFKPQDIK